MSLCPQVWIEDAAVLRFRGSDRLAWLQGQLTQDVASFAPGATVQACLCAPTGAIEAVLVLHELGDETVLITNRAGAQAVLKRVQDFVILEDVEASLSEVVVVFSPAASMESALLSIPHARAGEGMDHILPRDYDTSLFQPRETLSAFSFQAGTVDPSLDIRPGTVPADLGPRFFEAHVSLTKGCYTGQEVIHRMYARSAGKWHWCVLALDGQPTDHSAFTRIAETPDGLLAGAFVHKSDAEEHKILSIGGTTARIVMLG